MQPNHPQRDDNPWIDPLSTPVQRSSSSPYSSISGGLNDLSGPALAPPPPNRPPVPPRGMVIALASLGVLFVAGCSIIALMIAGHSSNAPVAALATATSTAAITDQPTATAVPVAAQPTPLPTNTLYPDQPTYTPLPTATLYPTPTPVITEYDNAATGTGHFQFDYHGVWEQDSRSGYYQTTDSYTNDPQGYVTFVFTGTRAQLIVGTNNNVGIMGITIDGGNEVDKDGYSPTLVFGVDLYDSGALPRATHTLKLFVTGKKNPLAIDVYIDVDAIKVYA